METPLMLSIVIANNANICTVPRSNGLSYFPRSARKLVDRDRFLYSHLNRTHTVLDIRAHDVQQT